MDSASELEEALERLCNGQPVEVLEDGRRVPGLDSPRYEIRSGRKPLLHLWSDDHTLVRRVNRIVEDNGSHLRLEVERFGQSKPGRLELVRRERERAPARVGRERYAERLGNLLRQQFPDEPMEMLTTSPDLEHSISGSYARGWQRRGSQAWAVLGAASSETSATIDASLTFGLIWLDWLRTRSVAPQVAGLRLFLPAGSGRLVAHRMGALATGVAVELYEWQEEQPLARRLDPADAGNITTWLTPRRRTELILEQVRETDGRMRGLASNLPGADGAIDSVVLPGTSQVAWRFRGLEFARWEDGEIQFEREGHRAVLTGRDWRELERVVGELAAHRHAEGPRRHPLYRTARERWLETMVLAEPTRIEARLDAGQVYSQVPAFSARDRGVIDLLGATRDGRLAVIELKADEDLQLIFQAVDYWLRVRWHQLQGDFEKYGYFPGKRIQPGAPLLYLVAPGLRFHSATRVLMRYLRPEIPICRVGIHEDWRRGLRVVEREWRTEPRQIGQGAEAGATGKPAAENN